MISLEYIYKKSTYEYNINVIHPLLELFRMQVYNNLITKILNKSNERYKDKNTNISFTSVKKYFSRFIIFIIAKRTHARHIKLNDGFFNNIDNSESQFIYDLINKYFEDTRLINDEFNIKNKIEKIIIKLTTYSKSLEDKTFDSFIFDKNVFTIDNKILSKYQLDSLNLQVPENIYLKLKNIFSGPTDNFHSYLLCCLLRYKTLGNKMNQLAIDNKYKLKLKHYGFNFECFSNVFSHLYDHYCSFFYDIEQYFNSLGSFFGLEIVQGCFMANPSYDPSIFESTYQKIKIALQNNQYVSFILSLPKWENSTLEEDIINEKIYRNMQIKYEYLTDVLTTKKYLTSPFYSFLFYNDAFSKIGNINEITDIFNKFENYHLEFPFRNRIYENEYKMYIFKKLQEENLIFKIDTKRYTHPNINLKDFDYKINGRYEFIMSEKEKYKYYMLSDLFNDECRAICTFGSNISPYDFWIENKNKLIEAIEGKSMEVNPINLREEIFIQTTECSIHNPLIIKYFITKYRAKKILDPSSGWGDRLIGALSSNIDLYVGIDPNICLHKNYQKIIKLLLPLSKNPHAIVQMLQMGFQEYQNPDNIKFDLIYTSPPYFDYEIYSSDNAQSVKYANSEDQWLVNFIYKSVDKEIEYLIDKGHLVLYFSQQKGKTYMEKFFFWIKSHKNIYYMGNMFYSNLSQQKIHPIFIFKKSKYIPRVLYNPKLQISQFFIDKKKILFVNDNLLLGGTYLRGLVNYLRDLNFNEIIYIDVGDKNEIAIAYALQLLKSKCKLYVYSLDPKKIIVDTVEYIYPNTMYVSNINANIHQIPKYLDDKKFIKDLKNALLKSKIDKLNIRRLWIDISYPTLFYCLYDILTETDFQIINEINFEIKAQYLSRSKIYKNPGDYQKKFDLYNNRIWNYQEYFINDDYVWNIMNNIKY